MRNRAIVATLTALVLSFVVADTADAQNRRFFRKRGRVVQTYSPAWQSPTMWYPAQSAWVTNSYQVPTSSIHGTVLMPATTSQSFYTPQTDPVDVKPIPLGEKSHDGVVVKVGVNTLTMTNTADGKEHSHFVPEDAKITRDGASAKLDDLRKGDVVVVTTKTNPEMTVVKVDARQKR